MAFVADTIAAIMRKGNLTRKEAKVVFNSHRHRDELPNAAYMGRAVSRQVLRKLKREGGNRRPTSYYVFRSSKYMPHQGAQEIARRLTQS